MFRRLLTSVVVAAATVLVANQAKADLLLEPYLGYDLDSFKFNAPTAGGDYNYGVTGMNLGARVGFAMPLFFVAADYNMGTLGTTSISRPSNGNSETPSVSRSSLFVVAGAWLPLIRAYAGYGLINDWTFKFNNNETTFQGTALKFGGSFTGLPFVALNLEYMMSTFNKYKNPAGTYDISGSNTYTSATASSVMMSVSVPFRL